MILFKLMLLCILIFDGAFLAKQTSNRHDIHQHYWLGFGVGFLCAMIAVFDKLA